jgi:hypothetical protein
VGPRAFQEGETLPGRRLEIEDLADRLIARGIALLYAPSGAGKTSLVQAGLIPRLRREENLHVLPIIHVGRTPQLSAPTNANRYLLSTLASLQASPTENSSRSSAKRARGEEAASSVDADLENYLQEHSRSDADTLLIFDQFEEVLTLNPADRDVKTKFFRTLGQILDKPHRWALFAMREEYLGPLESYRQWLPESLTVSYRLEPLEEAAAREAILEPSAATYPAFSRQAAQDVVDYLRRVEIIELDNSVTTQLGPYVEPLLLQVVCAAIWDAALRDGVHEITSERIPGERHMSRALQSFYLEAVEAAVAATGIERQQILDWCGQKLITPLKTRSLVARGSNSTDGIPNAVIDALENNRLVHPVVRRIGERWYELTHDRMIEAIQEANRPESLKPTLKRFSKQALEDWLRDATYHLSRDRRTRVALTETVDQILRRMPYSPEEREQDARSARLLFACKVLDGDIDLARQELPELFAQLEDIWLSDIIQFKAYFVAEARGDGCDPLHSEENYFEAWAQITHRLSSPVKATGLGVLRAYIERYLTDGRFDTGSNPQAHTLVAKKAHRLWEVTRSADVVNWLEAAAYSRGFYENLIDANTDPQSDRRNVATERALLAFDTGNGPLLANCLEAAMAIYFLRRRQ